MNFLASADVTVAARKGSPTPRIFTPPRVELTPDTSLGFEVCDFAENILGIQLRPWQKFVLIHGLELDLATVPGSEFFDPATPKNRQYDYRFRHVLVLVARQNGKTILLDVLGLWRLFVDGAAEILSTAQTLKVAEDTLDDAFNIAKKIPALRKYLPFRNDRGEWNPFMRTANGSHQLELATVPPGLEEVLDVAGAPPSWFVVATNAGAGRSFSADLALLDELREHKNTAVWDAVAPTIIERPRNQIWGFSNAGDRSAVVLNRLRNVALKAIEDGQTDHERLCLMEWSAPPDCSIFDPDGWLAANPSLGWGVRTEEDMRATARVALDPTNPDADEAGFRTEYLCQFVDTLAPGKFTAAEWAALAAPLDALPDGAEVFVGIDCALEAKTSHIAVAFDRGDGCWHVEVVASRAGYRWVPEWLTARRDRWFTGTVGIQSTGAAPATVLVPLLKEAGIEVAEWRGADLTGSVIAYAAALRDGVVRHPGRDPNNPDFPPLLEAAALGVHERKLGDVSIWDRDKSTGDAAPFIATNIAWWLGHRTGAQIRSAYADPAWDNPDPDDPPPTGGDLTDYDGGLLIV